MKWRALFHDDAIVVVDKPAGLLGARDGSDEANLVDRLSVEYGKVFPVHRLDRDTSGVMVFARDEETHRLLNEQFEARAVHKTYHALVIGVPSWRELVIDAPLRVDADRRHRTLVDAERGKPSVTRARCVESFKRYSLIEAQPETGRTHQVRVHLASVGAMIAVDDLYGDGKPIFLSHFKKDYRASAEQEERPLLGRLGLHALRIAFHHPQTNELVTIEATYPKDFAAALKQLRKATFV
jgi:RluA family pseudouridine synthase